MAKTAVSQWSTTRASNSDIDGINIAEGCPAGNLNDAAREIMVQVKEQLGDVNVKGTDIASATTTDIGAATGVYVDITGTTTITGFGTKTAGVVRVLQFDGALTLTHNATSLILPGAANITTAAGDVAVMVSEGSGNWRCVSYQRSIGEVWEPIETTALSSVASWSNTDLSAFRILKVIFTFKPANDGETFLFQTDTAGGASWDTGASDYAFGARYAAAGTALSVDSGAHSGIYMNYGSTVGSDTGEGIWGEFTFYDFNKNVNLRAIGESSWYNTSGSTAELIRMSAARADANARNSLRIIGAGNISEGRVVLMGIRG